MITPDSILWPLFDILFHSSLTTWNKGTKDMFFRLDILHAFLSNQFMFLLISINLIGYSSEQAISIWYEIYNLFTYLFHAFNKYLFLWLYNTFYGSFDLSVLLFKNLWTYFGCFFGVFFQPNYATVPNHYIVLLGSFFEGTHFCFLQLFISLLIA